MNPPKRHKPRKPKLEGWQLADPETLGYGVIHSRSGRFWLGADQLKKIGKFFLAAAKWAREQEK